MTSPKSFCWRYEVVFKLEMKNMRTDWCKGCGYCVDVCPRGALSFSDIQNKQGYNVVALDEDKCINCGTCRIVCPDSVFVFVEV